MVYFYFSLEILNGFSHKVLERMILLIHFFLVYLFFLFLEAAVLNFLGESEMC